MLKKALAALGIFRAADTIYSIWVGKSLLGLAILSGLPVVISTLANGFNWGALDKYVLVFAATYAAFSVALFATIFVYEKISPKDKLALVDFNFGCDPVLGSNPIEASAFDAKIVLLNVGTFPLSYIVTDLDFRIQNTTISEEGKSKGGQVDVGQIARYFSGRVIFHHPIVLPVEGKLTVKWSYGKWGKEKFHRTIYLWVKFVPDSKVPSGVGCEWRYLPAP